MIFFVKRDFQLYYIQIRIMIKCHLLQTKGKVQDMFSINTLFSAVCKVKRRSKVKLHILWLWKDKDFFSQLTIWFLFCCIRLQQLSMSPLTALLSHFLCARVTSNFFLHILSFSFLAIFKILYFLLFFFSLFVSVINMSGALYYTLCNTF